MLKDLLKFNYLGNKKELHFFLFEALPKSEYEDLVSIRKYCITNIYSFNKSFDGIVCLLHSLSFIKIHNGKVNLNLNRFNPTKIVDKDEYLDTPDFYHHLFSTLQKEDFLHKFLNPIALKFSPEFNKFYIKENLIPFIFYPIRNLLFAIGYFEKSIQDSTNKIYVNNNFKEFHQNLVINIINKNREAKSKINLDRLKKDLALKEKLGLEAEIFTVEFEQKRLKNHIFYNSIKRISDEFVNAGFDIESFNNCESLEKDRFIEVKSYADDLTFFWTQNEVKIAELLGDQYFLYLIDRNKMNDVDYLPRIIQNPYKSIYNNINWIKDPENWRVYLNEKGLKSIN